MSESFGGNAAVGRRIGAGAEMVVAGLAKSMFAPLPRRLVRPMVVSDLLPLTTSPDAVRDVPLSQVVKSFRDQRIAAGHQDPMANVALGGAAAAAGGAGVAHAGARVRSGAKLDYDYERAFQGAREARLARAEQDYNGGHPRGVTPTGRKGFVPAAPMRSAMQSAEHERHAGQVALRALKATTDRAALRGTRMMVGGLGLSAVGGTAAALAGRSVERRRAHG